MRESADFTLSVVDFFKQAGWSQARKPAASLPDSSAPMVPAEREPVISEEATSIEQSELELTAPADESGAVRIAWESPEPDEPGPLAVEVDEQPEAVISTASRDSTPDRVTESSYTEGWQAPVRAFFKAVPWAGGTAGEGEKRLSQALATSRK